ncbi:MAG: FkbM family methyltransferase [Pseudomonadota bacterium]
MSTAAALPAPPRQDEGAPPMGAFALPAAAEGVRRLSHRLGTGPVARRGVSVLRRAALWGRSDPVDVEIFPCEGGQGIWARLHPRDNLSEKRAFAGLQFFDRAERGALSQAIAAHRGPGPFVFVDAGANAGLYSLAAIAAAGTRVPLTILAVEPDPETAARLRFNLAAADPGGTLSLVIEVALAGEAGEACLSAAGRNRGEVSIAADGDGRRVEAITLRTALSRAGLDRVDALKIDIEGMEAPVLEGFLASAPAALRPDLVILEAPLRADAAVPNPKGQGRALWLLRNAGYELAARTRLNAILTQPVRPISRPGRDDDTTGAARATRPAAAAASADLGG